MAETSGVLCLSPMIEMFSVTAAIRAISLTVRRKTPRFTHRKTKMKINTISFASVMLQIRPCVGQSNLVYYGVATNSLSVAFADTNLSASVCTSIVADLQICLQDWGKQSELDLGVYELGLVGYLYNPDKCPHYPYGIRFPRNLITNQTGALTLQIPKTLSDAYTNAFAFAAENSNIVAAAYEFVTFVSSTNFSTVSSNTISDYYLFKGATPEKYRKSFTETTNLMSQIHFYPPSVLGFGYSTNGPAATNLWMSVPGSFNPNGYEVAWAFFPAVWHDGKWKFCFWDVGWIP